VILSSSLDSINFIYFVDNKVWGWSRVVRSERRVQKHDHFMKISKVLQFSWKP
jgi:hypothetical protein